VASIVQVGKGRDVGLNQIATFEAKVASGNGEQALARDLYRLGQLLDFQLVSMSPLWYPQLHHVYQFLCNLFAVCRLGHVVALFAEILGKLILEVCS
jgi:callose synthase